MAWVRVLEKATQLKVEADHRFSAQIPRCQPGELLFQLIGAVAQFERSLIGAAISITQRGWKLPVDPADSVVHVACQGLVRVVIGAVFGAILVGLSKANLAFGGAANDLWALFGLSVAAGISERLVPDLLARSTEA